ncbi:Fic/DOC family N-terminal domain-containing protein [Stenotrophomonas sp.]|uniref:Fic family protein n=1 Tax=Stenotrophomonas sp. TaxID=69392 RepID=UPI002FCA89C4
MRKTDLSADRRRYLVACDDRPHVSALVAPPTPRNLDIGPTARAALREAELAIARLQGYLARTGLDQPLSRALQQREAVQSSQIEGTHATLSDLLTYQATRGTEGLPADVQETGRYVQALRLGLEAVQQQGRPALSAAMVHRLHQVLMQDKPAPFLGGQYRRHQVWIGGLRIEDATLVPAPPAAVPTLMEEFIASMLQYQPAEDEQYALVITAQLAIAHAQFETIHPYEDGNGRTGRLLLPLILAAEALPPLYLSGTLLRNRQHYYDCLASVQLRGQWDAWVTLLATAVSESCEDAMALGQDMASIKRGWELQLASLRTDAAARRLPDLLIASPIVSIRQVAELLAVSMPTASAAVRLLVDKGILVDPGDGRRWGRVFHAAQVLARLSEPPRRPGHGRPR